MKKKISLLFRMLPPGVPGRRLTRNLNDDRVAAAVQKSKSIDHQLKFMNRQQRTAHTLALLS